MTFKQKLAVMEKAISRYRQAEEELDEANEYIEGEVESLKYLEDDLKDMLQSPQDFLTDDIEELIKEQKESITACKRDILQGQKTAKRIEKKLLKIQQQIESM